MHGLSEDFYCWDKTPHQINLERGGFTSAHVFLSKSNIKQSQERNPEADAGAEALKITAYGLAHSWLVHTAFLSPPGPLPKDGSAHGQLGPSTSTIKPGNALQICLQANPMQSFHFVD